MVNKIKKNRKNVTSSNKLKVRQYYCQNTKKLLPFPNYLVCVSNREGVN